MKLLVLNGPNLNLLGRREPDIYGSQSLDDINRAIAQYVQTGYGERVTLQFFQTNHEGQLVDTIQNAPRAYAGIVYNPAAHTHYSVALRDAIAAVPTPVVEVHLSDITTREEFRRNSLMTDVCIGCFMGKGLRSYLEALDALIAHLDALSDEEGS
ncbi:MAG: type II 3-dehydroquinate dehydratase [Coriobacteriales bacterium]|jgi:3-dehydroquinate dehydratase-2|nr:type II 3-dehydroquinate dehydratase [Coriobacteriales bacterium]